MNGKVEGRDRGSAAAALLVWLSVFFAFAVLCPLTAYADHSPSFYIEWDAYAADNGYYEQNPHQGYAEGTAKCAVCHATHRAPVGGTSWTPNGITWGTETTPSADYWKNRWAYTAIDGPEMLLRSDVRQSCDYCHIQTSIGGKQLYGGLPRNRYGPWDDGFGHGNSCSSCHSVHGAATYKGPATSVILFDGVGLSGSGGETVTAQEEVYLAGTLGSAKWPGPGSVPATDAVDPLNVPMFPSLEDLYNGTNVRSDLYGQRRDAQISGFCSTCHANYSYSSEQTVNPNGSMTLFADGWSFPSGQRYRYKNHPMKSASDGTIERFEAQGSTIPSTTPVAFVGSRTCRSCHDAGYTGRFGVIYLSWPHFTPGYWKFMKSAAYQGDAQDVIPGVPISSPTTSSAAQAWLDDPSNYEATPKTVDGQCLKCHINSSRSGGVGITY